MCSSTRHFRFLKVPAAIDTSAQANCFGWQAAFLGVGALLVPQYANAHVKWFSKMATCLNTPLTPLEILGSPIFLYLAVLALAMILTVAFIDDRLVSSSARVSYLARRVDERMTSLVSPVLRIGMAFYFVAMPLYFWQSPIFLTPELHTSVPLIPEFQLTIAVLLLFRRTVLLAALGIALLFAGSVLSFGVFHMLDYQFFIGFIAFLVVDSTNLLKDKRLALTILRVTLSASFLWVSVEKWAYPAWTDELVTHDLHQILMNFQPKFFVTASGFVEFSLAFVLLFGRVASQIAAAVFLLLLSMAIPLVGAVDAIGHLPIILILFVLSTTKNTVGSTFQTVDTLNYAQHAMLFAGSIFGLVGAYYLSHEVAYHGTRYQNVEAVFSAVLLTLYLVRGAAKMICRKVKMVDFLKERTTTVAWFWNCVVKRVL